MTGYQLSDEEKEKLKPMIESAVSDDKYTVQLEFSIVVHYHLC